MSDENLILLSQSGDNEAFSQLVRKYSADAYRTAFMVLRDRDEVEDVVQESFLTCYRKIKSFRMESSFKTWLYRIVVNRCYDRLRKLNRENEALNKMSLNLKNGSEDIHSSIESRLDLREVILDLKPEHRLVLTLYYGMDFGVQKVADILGIPVGTVKSRLNSARNMIKKSLTVKPI
ncbi:MAG: RNA polymerase sigma factor [Desulfotomaculaceae bacterium]|nr:RNA polymerase sigma factor [Desulfotomaculaceae bacterium]MDD4766751.1 RNA polymerase sigma factor [Desulfotomaculaceae bacterium]